MKSVGANVLALTQEVLKSMYLAKVKMGTAGVLCAALLSLAGGSFVSLGNAQDAGPKPQQTAVKSESDADFIRRISKDLRNTDPSPAEIHFFVANKDASKRQRLIDLFIEERQAKKTKEANALREVANANFNYWWAGNAPYLEQRTLWYPANQQMQLLAATDLNMNGPRRLLMTTAQPYNELTWHLLFTNATAEPKRLLILQKDFYKQLQSAKDKADIARITQVFLDRLIGMLKDHPKSTEAPEVIRHIVVVYESQGKTVEADAWRAKLPKEAPKPPATGSKGK